MAQHTAPAVFSIDRLLSTGSNDRLVGICLADQQPQASGTNGYGAASETPETKPPVRKPIKRRLRTTFTNPQLEYLEHQFSTTQYMTGEDRIAIARQLGLGEIQVKVWFQNRRIKWRRLQHQTSLNKLKQARYAQQEEPADNQPTEKTMKT